MKLTPHIRKQSTRPAQAFTMVEVALSLAIIAFAIVAVIGILPTGMQVQRDNREETIINQDGMMLLEAIKNGQTNLTSLAENFEWIESYTNVPNTALSVREGRIDRTNMLGGLFTTNDMAYRLIGILSTPRFVVNTNVPGGYISNWVQAKFIANSGPLADRMVEDPTRGTRDFAFSYLVTVDIAPAVLSTVYSNAPAELGGDLFGAALQNNMYELRLNLSWPVYPNNTVGNGRKSFRSRVAGKLSQDTNGLYRFYPHVFNGVN